MNPIDRLSAQPVVLSVPATNLPLVRKAVERRTDALARTFDRLQLAPADIAEQLAVPPSSVERLFNEPRGAPAVMLDGEDAAGSREDVGECWAAAMRDLSWPADCMCLLRVARDGIAKQLDSLAHALGREGAQPPDGIVLPKMAAAADVDHAVAALARLESARGWNEGSIRVQLLIEGPAALRALPELVAVAKPRLAALMLGTLDYAAAIGLPDVNDAANATLQFARAALVNEATVAGVAAIDGMTLRFPPPVGEGAVHSREREDYLSAVAVAYEDAVAAARQGMSGKLAGHPAQVFAVLLAFGEIYSTAATARWAALVETYQRQADGKGGAMLFDGQMIDAASARHARTMLARAAAAGFLRQEAG